MWKAFLKKMKIVEELELSVVVKSILGRLGPIYDKLQSAQLR